MNEILNNHEFFNQLAEDYDLMISFAETIKRKKKILKNIITPGIKTAADIGCGTGTDSIALVQLGISVTAFDPSSEMIDKARKNAEASEADIKFSVSPAEDIPQEFNEKFDLVISFGNTFANIDKNKLPVAIKRCFELLREGGMLIIQILNYSKVISEKKRIVNITENDSKLFVRFYDFQVDYIVFNILKTIKSNLSDYSLISTKIYPHLKEDFKTILHRSGFKSLHFYSDLKLNPFDEKTSKDLIVKAIK